MLASVKFLGVAAALGVLAPAFADRLIVIPTGKKLPLGTYRFESLLGPGDPSSKSWSIGAAFNKFFDGQVAWERGDDMAERVSFDLGFNLVDPVIGFAPGFSVGVRDLTGESRDGRMLYAALTHYEGLTGTHNSDVPLEFTVGLSAGDRTGVFVGLVVPFTRWTRFISEYDTRRLTQGFQFTPTQALDVRWLHRPGESFWTVTLRLRQ
ncbi:MAG: hypothetical protein D8M22_06285 [Armatimonadetes bacterium]|nr:MAG: hypothetical protein UZ18_ATM001000718 [Armatimonadetes bacterium OLB18]MBL1152332.1 hypothetical protein [Armatimonadota bacterium]MBV6490105.1 hypothetical protein [Fimbriimonadaceae bacterium]GIK33061.1 MAG: hypothetical protein BroJett009_20530 [Armatimonadota bacterium]